MFKFCNLLTLKLHFVLNVALPQCCQSLKSHVLKVACAQSRMCSSCMVLKVTCPQSRVSSMSHGPWQRPLSLFRQYLQRGLLYLPCEQCLAISILQQSARSCLSLLLRICQARKQSMFRTMFDKAKKGTKCKLTKSPCWGCVSDRHKGC